MVKSASLITVLAIILILGFLIINMTKKTMSSSQEGKNNVQKAVFAGGCFWCIESDFENINRSGILEVISGYTGGNKENPSYNEVSSGKTGHKESVQIIYNPDKISYEELLYIFWKNIDPLDSEGQFCDRGNQYNSAIFYSNSEERFLAEKSKERIEEILNKSVATKIIKLNNFYSAEEYHQNYHKKHPLKYKTYRYLCGRDKRLKELWSDKPFKENIGIKNPIKPSDGELKEILSSIQYRVTQEGGTEPPFKNEYWDNKREGIYVDIVSGEPLFSSKDKYDSGTGWPSFTKPLEPENIIEKNDYKLFIKRTEVRSKQGDSHLGHVFKDGPKPTGKRYCMNSAALRFIPKERLHEEGYEQYLVLFNKKE